MGSALRDAIASHLHPDPPTPPAGVPAAVLVPIVDGAEPAVVYTRRTDSLRQHAGEVSFPGGRPHPDEPLLATALRETHEEIGLPAEAVEVVGALDPVDTRSSGFVIVPFVGLLAERPEFLPSPQEIADVFEAPLRHLLDAEQEVTGTFEGMRFHTYVYEVDAHTVWGATARITKHLLDLLRKEGWA